MEKIGGQHTGSLLAAVLFQINGNHLHGMGYDQPTPFPRQRLNSRLRL